MLPEDHFKKPLHGWVWRLLESQLGLEVNDSSIDLKILNHVPSEVFIPRATVIEYTYSIDTLSLINVIGTHCNTDAFYSECSGLSQF